MSNDTRAFRFPHLQNIISEGHSSTPGAFPVPTMQAGGNGHARRKHVSTVCSRVSPIGEDNEPEGWKSNAENGGGLGRPGRRSRAHPKEKDGRQGPAPIG